MFLLRLPTVTSRRPSQTLAAVAEDSSSSAPSSAGRRLLQGSATTPSTANVGVVVPTDGAAATATAVKAKLAAAIDAGTFARVLTGAGAFRQSCQPGTGCRPEPL